MADFEHRDFRSASRPFKRDKEHTAKWSMGVRVANSCAVDFMGNQVGGTPAQFTKERPEKKWSEWNTTEIKSHANVTRSGNQMGGAAYGRVSRKQDAMAESRAGESDTMSKSLLDLISDGSLTSNVASDEGVLYSFDAKSSPREQVGLDLLVKRAEESFKNKETDKLVRNEYEMLDESGEIVSKRKSPKNRPLPALVLDDDEEYEMI
jgi:hypothetical protein